MTTDSLLRRDHEEILRTLATAAGKNDGAGRSAKEVLETLRPHLEKEEELVMPVLDALGDLAIGGVASAEKPAEIAGRPSAEYHMMFREHEEILDKVNTLYNEAKKSGDDETSELAERLKAHIELEEAVLYPAAMVAAKYAEKIIKGEIESYRGLEQGEIKRFGATE